jgi:hypothetical protein
LKATSIEVVRTATLSRRWLGMMMRVSSSCLRL